jgi:DNA polymerase-4
MEQSGRATILHADLDAFYASVEQMVDPSLRGRPIAVGGGVVLAASYEARAFGVTGGMSGWRARELCPRLLFVSGHFREYQRLSGLVMEIFRDFTPYIEQVSIDEAFLQTAGATHLFGSPAEIGAAIRARVRTELGLPLSVGVARTKHLAKVASQVAKPDGLVVVDPDREMAFLRPLPVGLIWGVGPVTRARLEAVGIRTIGELADTRAVTLQRLLGSSLGAKVSSLALNADPRAVVTRRATSSVGAVSYRSTPPNP